MPSTLSANEREWRIGRRAALPLQERKTRKQRLRLLRKKSEKGDRISSQFFSREGKKGKRTLSLISKKKNRAAYPTPGKKKGALFFSPKKKGREKEPISFDMGNKKCRINDGGRGKGEAPLFLKDYKKVKRIISSQGETGAAARVGGREEPAIPIFPVGKKGKKEKGERHAFYDRKRRVRSNRSRRRGSGRIEPPSISISSREKKGKSPTKGRRNTTCPPRGEREGKKEEEGFISSLAFFPAKGEKGEKEENEKESQKKRGRTSDHLTGEKEKKQRISLSARKKEGKVRRGEGGPALVAEKKNNRHGQTKAPSNFKERREKGERKRGRIIDYNLEGKSTL